jgi:hypothetical protein
MSAASNHRWKRLTVRMPEPWRGQVTDAKLAGWLRSIPETLPPDPRGGGFRRSFALSAEAWERVRQHAGKLHADPSAWLRRLIAAQIAGHAAPPATLPSRPPVAHIRSIIAAETPKPVPALPRMTRSTPFSEDEGKKDFQKYVTELETIARSGRPEAGEAQARLAQIRKIHGITSSKRVN